MNHQDIRMTSFIGSGWNYLVLITASLLFGTAAISSHVTVEDQQNLQRLIQSLDLVHSTPDPHFGKTGEIFSFPRCELNGNTSHSLAGAGTVPWCSHSKKQTQ